MNAYVKKAKDDKSRAASNISSQKQNTYGVAYSAGNRSDAGTQQGYQKMADASAQVSQLRAYQEMAAQKQGSVKSINVMGQKALPFTTNPPTSVMQQKPEDIPGTKVAQLVLDQEDLDAWWNEPEEDWPSDFTGKEKEQLGKYRETKLKERAEADTTRAALASIKGSGSYKSWTYDGETYHLNFKYGTNHVTWESTSRMHYFFKGSGEGISDEQPERGERGQHGYVFSELPVGVQTFIKTYFLRLI